MLVPRTMDCTKWFICFSIFLEFCSRSEGQAKENYLLEAGQIFGTIFHKYNPGVLPWEKYPEPLDLTLQVTPVYVASVDPIAQLMTSTIDLQVTWSDKALAWFTRVVKELTVSKDKVWHPHISVNNAVGSIVEMDTPDLILSREGVVKMKRRLQVNTICETPIDATEYNCSIRIGTTLFDSDMVMFSNKSSFDTGSLVVAHPVELSGSSVEISEVVKEYEIVEGKDENATDTVTPITFPEFVGTLTLTKTGCCETGNGVTSLRSISALTALALVIAQFAQQ